MQPLLATARRCTAGGGLHSIIGRHQQRGINVFITNPSSRPHQHHQRKLYRQRFLSSTRRNMLETKDLDISKGEDPETVSSEASQLVDEGRWKLCNEGRGLERTFRFKTFKLTWDFMNAVAAQCKIARHHPEWSNVYNRTEIRWTTHNPRGLSTKDTSMARFCDSVAEQFGELRDADAELVGDCCGGKTKKS